MDYVVGMDGGGTKTRAKIADLQGNVYGTFDGGSSNINSSSIEDVRENILSLLSSSINALDLEPSACRGICLGSAGAGRKEDKLILESIIKEAFPHNVTVVDDAAILLASACESAGDIVLIAGTGSICYGLSHDGSYHRTGGWGHIIGDEAGAYDIAVRMLKAVMRAYDGRGEKTVLTKLILNHLGISGEQELIPYVYRAGNGKREIASLARLLSDGCALNDPVCMDIAENSAQQLTELVDAMYKKLAHPNNEYDSSFSLILNGSVIRNNIFIRKFFTGRITAKYPFVIIKDFEGDAADGALKLIIAKVI